MPFIPINITHLRSFVFVLYAVLAFLGISNHELWGDELHSWCIAANSDGILKLLHNSHYEGHPPIWYLVLRLASLISRSALSMQIAQFIISVASAYLILFKLRLPVWVSALVLAGYYFSFEYLVFSRNYGIVVLCALTLLVLRTNNSPHKSKLYFLLLFILSNTHILGLLLAFSLHVSCYSYYVGEKNSNRWLSFILGLMCLLPAVYFILPPSDSSLGWDFWGKIWKEEQFTVAGQALPRAFFPLPNWQLEYVWNTNYFMDQIGLHPHVRLESWLISIFIIAFLSLCLFKFKPALMLFLINVMVTWSVAVFFPLYNARYVGCLYIAFVIAIVLVYQEQKNSPFSSILISIVLLLQLPGVFVMRTLDAKRPFSMSQEVPSIVRRYPACLLTDYWSIGHLSGMTGKVFYCIGYQKESYYTIWNKDMSQMMKNKSLYARDLEYYFNTQPCDSVFLCSIHNLDLIRLKDTMVAKQFNLELREAHIGSIEKYSNLYVYYVSRK